MAVTQKAIVLYFYVILPDEIQCCHWFIFSVFFFYIKYALKINVEHGMKGNLFLEVSVNLQRFFFSLGLSLGSIGLVCLFAKSWDFISLFFVSERLRNMLAVVIYELLDPAGLWCTGITIDAHC